MNEDRKYCTYIIILTYIQQPCCTWTESDRNFCFMNFVHVAENNEQTTFWWQISHRAQFSLPKVDEHLHAILSPTSTPTSSFHAASDLIKVNSAVDAGTLLCPDLAAALQASTFPHVPSAGQRAPRKKPFSFDCLAPDSHVFYLFISYIKTVPSTSRIQKDFSLNL